MGSVVGSQFGEDVPHSTLDGFFADRELIGNLLVGVAGGNQTQDRDFPRGQGVIGGMLGKLEGDFRGDRLFAGMDGANRLQKFLMQEIF